MHCQKWNKVANCQTHITGFRLQPYPISAILLLVYRVRPISLAYWKLELAQLPVSERNGSSLIDYSFVDNFLKAYWHNSSSIPLIFSVILNFNYCWSR